MSDSTTVLPPDPKTDAPPPVDEKPRLPTPHPGGGGTLPDGSSTNDPAVWSRWVREYTADSMKSMIVGSPKPTPAAPGSGLPPTAAPPGAGAPPSAVAPGMDPPLIKDKAELAKVPPGANFRWSDGKVRRKPYDVTDDATYQAVPLGAQYIEGGKLKVKPAAAGGLDPRAQTLFDMAHTSEGRKKALEYIYGPGTVHEDRGDIYVLTRDGTRLSPKAFTPGSVASRAVGAVASGAMPAVGAGVGALAGAIPGLPGGPVGAIASGLAGSGAGGALGEAGNQAVLRGLGVEDLPPGRSWGEMGISGLVGAGGNLVAAAAPTLFKTATKGLPAALRYLVGFQPEEAALAKEAAREGARVPLTSYAKEVPYIEVLLNIAKQFGYDPSKESAKIWMPKVMDRLLKEVGVPAEERGVVGQTAAVSLEPAGQAAVDRARAIVGQANEKLNGAVAAYRAVYSGAAAGERDTAQREIQNAGVRLSTEGDAARAAANTLLKRELDAIEAETTAALKASGSSPGDLSREWSKKIWKLRSQLSTDAKRMYGVADELAAGHAPVITGLREWAAGLIDEVPPAVAAEYPREVATIAKLAGRKAEGAPPSTLLDQFGHPMAGEPGVEAPVTFGDLHQLRTFLRSKVDWGDLTRGPKQGMVVQLERATNQALNSVEATPELQEAAKALRRADDFYSENIRRFEDATVRQIAQFGRAATAPDAEQLARLTLAQGNTERIRMLREMGGPELWQRVVAADTHAMLNAAGLQDGKVNAQEFANQIIDRARSGVLKEAYPPAQAERLRLQAERISRVYGKVPMTTHPGDTVGKLMDRSDALIEQAKALATKRPLELFEASMKQIDAEVAAMKAVGKAEAGQDPLHSLTNLGAEEAAKKILANPDLIAAVERKFGADSSEFTMLRQVYARRILQDMADATLPAAGRQGGSLTRAAESFMNLSPETQQRLFPGVSKEQMTRLIRKIVLMFPADGSDIGSQFAGKAAIIRPEGSTILGKEVGHSTKNWPAPVARFVLSKAFSTISKLATSPKLLEFIASGYDGKPPGAEAADEVLRSIIRSGARVGAVNSGLGMYGKQQGDYFDDPTRGEAVPFVPWNERLKAKPAENPPGFVPWNERLKATP